MEFLIYAGIGILAGFFAGLLGIGGGALIGPLLISVFVMLLHFDPSYATHLAIGTALGVIVFTAPISAFTHAQSGNVQWRIAKPLAVGVLVGAYLGVEIAVLLSPFVIKIALAVFLLANAAQLFRSAKSSKTAAAEKQSSGIRPPELLFFAVIIGVISSVAGIGGGILTVPYLARRGIGIKQAIGTSSFIGFPLALAASGAYIFRGWDNTALPENAWGYVYMPAVIGIAAFSIVSAYAGARMTAKLPTATLRHIFALLLIVVATQLFI